MATTTTGIESPSRSEIVSEIKDASSYRRWGKRVFDLIASAVGLLVTAPVLLICSLLVRLTSGSPVFFRQLRVGQSGRFFKVIKFRTMVNGADIIGAAVVKEGDPRVTPVGAFLRRTKLDELPQLFNVLRGEMSIVGPRPRVPSEVDPDDPREQVVQSVRPGLTSYASVHHRTEADYCARHPDPQRVHRTSLIPQKLLLDREYAENLSLSLDLRLIFLTFLLVFVPGQSLANTVKVFGREICPYSRIGQVVLDLAIFAGAVLLAYQLRFDGRFNALNRRQMLLLILALPVLRTGTNKLLGTYDMMWRYINLADALVFAMALAPTTATLLLLRLGLPTLPHQVTLLEIPLSVIALEYLISLSAGLGLRSLRRTLYVLHHHYQPLPETRRRRVMILGAGLTGLSAASDMRRYPQIETVGFLDDNPSKRNRIIARCRVMGNSEELEILCARHRVTDLVICAGSLESGKLQKLRRRCLDLNVRCHVMPTLDSIFRDETGSAKPDETALWRLGTELSGNQPAGPVLR